VQNIPFHPMAGIFPLLHGNAFADLQQDINENGLLEPIVLFDGQVLDGRNRFRACQEIGTEPAFAEYQGNDPLQYVISLNLHRRHLSESQRAMVGAKIANIDYGGDRVSDQAANLQLGPTTRAEAADMLNISERSVNTAKKVERDGAPELVDAVERGGVSVSAAADVATLPQDEQAEVVARGEVLLKAREMRNVRGTQGTGDNEWYTPALYIEAVRQVLERIDLDPASSAFANQTVGATTYYTEKDNGLKQNWQGKVWMNPPYAQPLIMQFIKKLTDEYNSGNISEAIVLTHNYTDTQWFHCAQKDCAAICFTRGRIRFLNANGKTCSPTQGQAFFYFGENIARFNEAFQGLGFVVQQII